MGSVAVRAGPSGELLYTGRRVRAGVVLWPPAAGPAGSRYTVPATPPTLTQHRPAAVITAPQSCNALLSALVIRGNIISVKKTVLQCMNALLVLLCHRQITILIRRPCDRC